MGDVIPDVQLLSPHNPSRRLPVVLCIDVSLSMEAAGAFEELRAGLKLFFDAMNDNSVLRRSSDIAVVVFAGETFVARRFSPISDRPEPPPIAPLMMNLVRRMVGAQEVRHLESHGTALHPAVRTAVSMLRNRLAGYRELGLSSYPAHMLILSDGEANRDNSPTVPAACRELERRDQVVIFPILVQGRSLSESAPGGLAIETLRQFSAVRRPRLLTEMRFPALFSWLQESIAAYTRSQPGTSFRAGAINGFLSSQGSKADHRAGPEDSWLEFQVVSG